MKKELDIKSTVACNEKGNLIVSYEKTNMKNTLLHIILPAAIFLIILIGELTAFQTAFSLIPILPLLLYSLFNWGNKTIKYNVLKEENVVFNCLNPIILNDISKFGKEVIELDRKYIQIEKEEQIIERYVLILLSNKKELKYSIINPKESYKIQLLEIDLNAIIID